MTLFNVLVLGQTGWPGLCRVFKCGEADIWRNSMVFNINRELGIAISAIAGMITIGTVAYKLLEGWSWVKCFYFSVVSLTTVGYGDLYPTTDASRLFTALYVLTGVAITLASLGVIGSHYLEERERQLLEGEKRLLEKKGKAK
jgi:voltage-gated potassium channel